MARRNASARPMREWRFIVLTAVVMSFTVASMEERGADYLARMQEIIDRIEMHAKGEETSNAAWPQCAAA